MDSGKYTELNRNELIRWAANQNASLTVRQMEQLAQYKNNVLLWNEKINLTAITNEPDFTIKHFIDSLTVLPWIPQNAHVIDVGTGAGFPGLPVKIARPDITLILLDSLRKRIFFLQETVQLLGLKEVSCIHTRAEDWQKEGYQYDICTARAVARLDVLVRYTLPLVKPGGLLLAMKGPDVTGEVKQAATAIKKWGGKLSEIQSCTIAQDITHSIVVIKKDCDITGYNL